MIFFAELLMVPQEGSCQMLHGVKLGCVHNRLLIGRSHTDIEGCDDFFSQVILSRHIHAGFEKIVVYGKTLDFFHVNYLRK